MKKLRLQLEELAVESFAVAEESNGSGTVEGYDSDHTSPDFGCGSGVQGCRTYYDWTGCDYSCVWGPCESFEECSLGGC